MDQFKAEFNRSFAESQRRRQRKQAARAKASERLLREYGHDIVQRLNALAEGAEVDRAEIADLMELWIETERGLQ